MTKPPPLTNDCFALPQGVHWTPVDAALAHLRANLSVVAGTKAVPLHKADGRILSQAVTAQRNHPPTPNSAVDGYGLAGPVAQGEATLGLLSGRSAAGDAYADAVPAGHALRVLTGAALPDGVDTVVLQEDVVADGGILRFNGPLKRGANARQAGEDMTAGQKLLNAGHTLTPADIGMLAAAGVGQVNVRKRLRVGVLSTGDELAQPGKAVRPDQIYDANRPMLGAVVARWGHRLVDLGTAPDDRQQTRGILTDAAKRCDVILTSGGASAGDEDHMSALLQDTGSFALWRVAMKPGRPLAMGLWNNTPVLGLPGNPVAAMVCTLIFARPVLSVLAGGGWTTPIPISLPALFAKSKKAGRREYLRARVVDGQLDVFPSEGSGRVSGLSWAGGLVELPDEALTVTKGDNVTYYPYSSFGL